MFCIGSNFEAEFTLGSLRSLYSLRCCGCADPFLNDETFLVAQLSLKENGATGNKGLAGILGNPVLATSVAGLATSATAFSAVEVGVGVSIRHEGKACLRVNTCRGLEMACGKAL